MRTAAGLPDGAEGALDPEQRQRLEEIDPWWNPAWPLPWQRAYAVARMWWLASDGVVDWTLLPADVDYEGERLGRWVREQRAAWPDLAEEQRELLAAIGIAEDQALAAARTAAVVKVAGRRSQAERFHQGLAALAQYVGRVGHAKVPCGHKEVLEPAAGPGAAVGEGGAAAETVTVSLGVWVNNTKARRDKLNPEQLTALEELGVAW